MKKSSGWLVSVGVIILVGITALILLQPNSLKRQSEVNNSSRIAGKSTLPSMKKSKQMVLETTLHFGRAANAGDYSSFYKILSEEFKSTFSQEQFTKTFSGFIQQKINILPVKNHPLKFNENPSLAEDGTLILKGYFSTQPSRVYFDYKYSRSSNDWQLSGIDISVQPVKQ
ncbi:MAG: hypothetical protein GY779_13100 [Gammaproteobacteria bacterium]|nr:hypothetical protein [Gammaproteobacteria bacterium]